MRAASSRCRWPISRRSCAAPKTSSRKAAGHCSAESSKARATRTSCSAVCMRIPRGVSTEALPTMKSWPESIRTILNGYLRIEYFDRLPLLCYTPAGLEIEIDSFTEKLVARLRRMSGTEPDIAFLESCKEMPRATLDRLLEKIEATGDPAFIPMPLSLLDDSPSLASHRCSPRPELRVLTRPQPRDEDKDVRSGENDGR